MAAASGGSSSGSATPRVSGAAASSSPPAAESSKAASGPTLKTAGSHVSSSRGDSFGCGSRAGSGSSVRLVDWECLELSTSPRSWLSSGATSPFGSRGAVASDSEEGTSSSSSGCCADVRGELRGQSASKAAASVLPAAALAPAEPCPGSCAPGQGGALPPVPCEHRAACSRSPMPTSTLPPPQAMHGEGGVWAARSASARPLHLTGSVGLAAAAEAAAPPQVASAPPRRSAASKETTCSTALEMICCERI
mmetsp:Transcript_50873/g.162816  ORF Transcript_50873/g.162816 Transcript_50873/m.162816 type:complete len:251 (+) Transcript_50873:960-1712(+)